MPFLLCSVLLVETGSLEKLGWSETLIFTPQHPECWDDSPVRPHLALCPAS